jgi:hypothetical protein
MRDISPLLSDAYFRRLLAEPNRVIDSYFGFTSAREKSQATPFCFLGMPFHLLMNAGMDTIPDAAVHFRMAVRSARLLVVGRKDRVLELKPENSWDTSHCEASNRGVFA